MSDDGYDEAVGYVLDYGGVCITAEDFSTLKESGTVLSAAIVELCFALYTEKFAENSQCVFLSPQEVAVLAQIPNMAYLADYLVSVNVIKSKKPFSRRVFLPIGFELVFQDDTSKPQDANHKNMWTLLELSIVCESSEKTNLDWRYFGSTTVAAGVPAEPDSLMAIADELARHITAAVKGHFDGFDVVFEGCADSMYYPPTAIKAGVADDILVSRQVPVSTGEATCGLAFDTGLFAANGLGLLCATERLIGEKKLELTLAELGAKREELVKVVTRLIDKQ